MSSYLCLCSPRKETPGSLLTGAFLLSIVQVKRNVFILKSNTFLRRDAFFTSLS
jgi:hypothetical protein